MGVQEFITLLVQALRTADIVYKSRHSGEQIDDAIDKILNGLIENLVALARQYAQDARTEADRADSARQLADSSRKLADTARQLAESTERRVESTERRVESAERRVENLVSLSESWAVGGTGKRTGEDQNNSKYYAILSQAAAEQATTPVISRTYHAILQDRNSGRRYALIVECKTLKLMEVSASLDAAEPTVLDTESGIAYGLIAENGVLKLKETGTTPTIQPEETYSSPGVYGLVLSDQVTGGKYALVIEQERLSLLGVASTVQTTEIKIFDETSGELYELVLENQLFKLKEVT